MNFEQEKKHSRNTYTAGHWGEGLESLFSGEWRTVEERGNDLGGLADVGATTQGRVVAGFLGLA